jgi:hypothetical protein
MTKDSSTVKELHVAYTPRHSSDCLYHATLVQKINANNANSARVHCQRIGYMYCIAIAMFIAEHVIDNPPLTIVIGEHCYLNLKRH